eukprot:TRINITY_DN26958_c0_g1_i1.p1 TRINITY_DN26958_c0_g1~~TRINITY_DN26958_c0_g1_i1.p1  ORF type:complete len:181 (-),score=57.44 TRINITY_DN26958_c0_g1_i1:140-682(-)
MFVDHHNKKGEDDPLEPDELVLSVRNGAVISGDSTIDECVTDKQDLYLLPRADDVKEECATTVEQMAYQLVKEMPSDYADFLRAIATDPELGSWVWDQEEALQCSRDVCTHLRGSLCEREQSETSAILCQKMEQQEMVPSNTLQSDAGVEAMCPFTGLVVQYKMWGNEEFPPMLLSLIHI